MQMRSGQLRLDSRLSRARQELGRTEVVILELRNKRRKDITVELQKTQIDLRKLQQQYKTREQLLYETEVVAPRLLAKVDALSQVKRSIIVIRRSNKGIVRLAASEMFVVRPGDTIKIELPRHRRNSFGLGQSRSAGNFKQAAQSSSVGANFAKID